MNEISYFGNYRVEMLDFVPQHCKKILEIGCGEGFFGLQLAKRQEAEVWGVEPNQDAAKKASTRLFNVQNVIYNYKIQLPHKYFVCIVFNDVLEHMYDPWEALEISKKFLVNKESVVVASIPNFRYWENIRDILIEKEFRYTYSGILDKTHLRFFTKKSIIDLFSTSSYEVSILCGINPSKSRKIKYLNRLLLNKFEDMQFLQFAVVAHQK